MIVDDSEEFIKCPKCGGLIPNAGMFYQILCFLRLYCPRCKIKFWYKVRTWKYVGNLKKRL